MAETIIKYNRPKENKRGGAIYISANRALYNDSVSNTASTTNITGNTMWQTSQGNGSLVPSGSNNIAAGQNSVAIGTNTQTTNEGELAVGTYNKSTEGMTLFSVGDGTSENDRHNVFEVDYTGFTSTNGIIEGDLQAGKGIFGDAKVNGLLDTNQLQAISGYIQTLLSDEITCDYLTVTKAAHFFKLIIDEIKATQGAVIITPANAVLDKVDTINGGWRCYYRSKDDSGRQIYNCFEIDDQVVCQTFDAATGTSYNVSNQWYWRKVIGTGTTTTTINGSVKDVHYFDLSSTDCDRYSMTPKVGDNCVQLGNRTDTTRQAAIIISAYNSQWLDKGIKAPSIVQYQGINDYDLSTHRLNIISNGLNEFKGGYYNNAGKNIETIISETATTMDGKITALNGVVTSHTQSISNLQQTDEQIKSTVSANTTSIGTLNNRLNTVSGTVNTNSTNIATLQQTANGLTSTVSSHTTSITTLNNNVNTVSGNVNSVSGNVNSISGDVNSISGTVKTVSGDVKTIKKDYVTSSQLNQTATGITSTVAANYVTKTTFNTLSGDVQTIENTYVSSSELNQTASSITASVTDGLKNTGIDIQTGEVNISATTVNVKGDGNSENNTWIVLGNRNNYPFGIIGPYSASLFNAFNKYVKMGAGTNGGYFTAVGGNSQINMDFNGTNLYPALMLTYNTSTDFGFRIHPDGYPQKKVNGTWINTGGKYARKISSNTTLAAYDEIVFVTNGSTITLPTSGNYLGRTIEIVRTGSSTVFVSGNINGGSRTIPIDLQYEINRLMYDGNTWIMCWMNTQE